MAVMLIARLDGEIGALTQAYDRAHALIMSRGGATGVGELRVRGNQNTVEVQFGRPAQRLPLAHDGAIAPHAGKATHGP